MTDDHRNCPTTPYARGMLGVWPQLLLVLLALYFAGAAFAGTVMGRWLVLFPLLMSFVPFVWHVQRVREILSPLEPLLSERFGTLSLGLGMILFILGTLWIWRYAISIFLFPLLALLVYYVGPWMYLKNNLTTIPALLETNSLAFFAAFSSLSLLAYTLPYVRDWLRPPKDTETTK